MENQKWASTEALANMATGMGIFSLIPCLFGMIDNKMGCIPWMIGGLFCALIAVVGCFKNGDLVGGTANGILSITCLFGNMYQAVIELVCASNISENMKTSFTMCSGTANLAASVFCGSVAILAWEVNKLQAIGVAFPTVAFFMFFLIETGITAHIGYVPQICLVIFGCWMIYSGIAMMYHQATGKQIIPYIW